MHLCIFLLEARFNQFSTHRKCHLRCSFIIIIIQAAQFCRQCNSLQHPSEISLHVTSAQSNNGCKSETYTCLEASSMRHDSLRSKRFRAVQEQRTRNKSLRPARKMAPVKELRGGGEERQETLADKPRDFANRPLGLPCLSSQNQHLMLSSAVIIDQ